MVNGLCYKLLYFSNNLTVHIYVYTIAGVEPHILLLFILERRGGQGEKNIQRCEARAVCSLTCSSHSKFICSLSLFFFWQGKVYFQLPVSTLPDQFLIFFFSCVFLLPIVPKCSIRHGLIFFLAVTFQGLMEIGYVSKAKENWLFAGIDLIYFLKTVNFL